MQVRKAFLAATTALAITPQVRNLPHTCMQSPSYLTTALAITPQIFDYRSHAGALEPVASGFESRPNTPPTFAVYMLDLTLDHLQSDLVGGLRAHLPHLACMQSPRHFHLC